MWLEEFHSKFPGDEDVIDRGPTLLKLPALVSL